MVDLHHRCRLDATGPHAGGRYATCNSTSRATCNATARATCNSIARLRPYEHEERFFNSGVLFQARDFYFDATECQSRLDGRNGSTACTVIACLTVQSFVQGNLPWPSYEEMNTCTFPDDIRSKYMEILRDGNAHLPLQRYASRRSRRQLVATVHHPVVVFSQLRAGRLPSSSTMKDKQQSSTAMHMVVVVHLWQSLLVLPLHCVMCATG